MQVKRQNQTSQATLGKPPTPPNAQYQQHHEPSGRAYRGLELLDHRKLLIELVLQFSLPLFLRFERLQQPLFVHIEPAVRAAACLDVLVGVRLRIFLLKLLGQRHLLVELRLEALLCRPGTTTTCSQKLVVCTDRIFGVHALTFSVCS
jgi:hypothetical protein